ncbi:DUF1003 domain-containing protein [Micrococcales bacterium 31B]|nr:DUF1003 domain-containing protein [Micrococcales bacterium 31B]
MKNVFARTKSNPQSADLSSPQPRRKGFDFSEFGQGAFGNGNFGKVAERIATFSGSAAFLGWMTGIILVYVIWNVVAPSGLRFDPYSFTFLTLLLSLQASYAAPLILLAQNRQADRDRAIAELDRQQAQRNLADTEFITREIASVRQSIGSMNQRSVTASDLRRLESDLSGKMEELREMLQALAASQACSCGPADGYTQGHAPATSTAGARKETKN